MRIACLICLLFYAFTIKATPLKQQNIINPNEVRHYISKEAVEELESSIKIDTDLSKVTFYLYTPERGVDDPWEFKAGINPNELLIRNFDPKRQTKFIAHGWTVNGNFSRPFAEALFSHPDLNANIISVDWSPLATWDSYVQAAINAVRVGTHCGKVIGVDILLNGLGQTPDKIHAIGHSLGGQLVGHFGRQFKKIGKQGSIARITSLDPAKPWFDVSAASNTISKDDAEFVDVMHTNSGFLLNGRLSIKDPLGHIDYYPNGGEHQAGCKDIACIGTSCLSMSLWDLFNGACSHSRSHEYYVESIFSKPVGEVFISKSCDSWEAFENDDCHNYIPRLPMGEGLDIDEMKELIISNGGQLSYYLTTNQEPPFSLSSTINPNLVKHYVSKEALEKLEPFITIDTDLSKVSFLLWTPERGINDPLEFKAGVNPDELLFHNFDPNRPTKFVAHGWTDDGFIIGEPLAEALFSHPDLNANVISVDWYPLATWDNYLQAAHNAVRVGTYCGEVIGVNLLLNGLGQSPDQIHAIGHSLGGQMVGHFGREFKRLSNQGPIARITSLDPAKPWFDVTAETNTISKDDAQLVDVIHTNSGFLLNGRLSIMRPLGDIDYYPNGGQHQTGCKDIICVGTACLSMNLWDLFSGGCSHQRSHQYYVESIYAKPFGEVFISDNCNSWEDFQSEDCHDYIPRLPMGEGLDIDRIGGLEHWNGGQLSYYLTTNQEPPYAQSSTILPNVVKSTINPNLVKYYVSKLGIQQLESSTKISTDLSKVRFVLWTPENGVENSWEFKAGVDPQELLNRNFNPQRPTKFISHGWNSNSGFAKGFVEGFYSDPDMQYNVIAVDYHPLATWDNYFQAALNAVRVGEHAGQVIGVDLLLNGLGQSPDQIHAIGHSLGGQLVGHFGRKIKETGGQGPISRISSLDPAKPWFDLSDPSNTISKDDAAFVDVIHTNSGFLLNGRLSILSPLGHIDYYPNGGQHQAGCKDIACVGTSCLSMNLWDLFNGACSHQRAPQYYIESIYAAPIGGLFLSESCDSWENFENDNCHEHIDRLPMGFGLDIDEMKILNEKTSEGHLTFYLTTNKEPPFAHTSNFGDR